MRFVINLYGMLNKCNSSLKWSYFTIDDTEWAKHNLCNMDYSSKGRIIKAMENNLKTIFSLKKFQRIFFIFIAVNKRFLFFILNN